MDGQRDAKKYVLQASLFMLCSGSQVSSIATPDDRARCGRRQRVPQMERQEASGSSHGPARPGTPTALKALAVKALGPGSSARRPADRKAGLTEPRKLRGASRRSIPLPCGREKENRETGAPGRPKTKPRAAERWLSGALAEGSALTLEHLDTHIGASRIVSLVGA
jgi:hypothetical protein